MISAKWKIAIMAAGAVVTYSSLMMAQWTVQESGTRERLRAVCAVNEKVVWASGNSGTYVRTVDGGEHWQASVVPGADTLDFRDVHAVDEQTAYLMSIGPGERSMIYKTVDGGTHWQLQFRSGIPSAFFDAFAFWDADRGIAVSDAVEGKLLLIKTSNGGKDWEEVPKKALPPALAGEGAFAASGTPIATYGNSYVWIGTGFGPKARVFRSVDGGGSWDVNDAPIKGGTGTTGIFSIAFLDSLHGVIVGGDYARIDDDSANVAVTTDGGRTWIGGSASRPAGFRSCVVFVPGTSAVTIVAVGPSGSDYSLDGGKTWVKIGNIGFHAVTFAGPKNAGWAVGEEGRIARFEGPAPDLPQQPSVATIEQQRINSPDSALQAAMAFLKKTKVDVSRHDMSKPEGIQKITLGDHKAWRVSWRLKDFTGKGGQMIVIVYESGQIEQGWGE